MNFAAIIAEYNPFHNGHAYLVQQLREAGATHIAAVMSGHIVQRADVACFSKWTRAAAAVACGVDLVFELPVLYACAPAERFALGAVGTLNGLGLSGMLGFGSECGDISVLEGCVEALDDVDSSPELAHYLSRGFAFPSARTRAIADRSGEVAAQILTEPNNILAVEYLKALRKTGSALTPFTVKRQGAGHDSRTAVGSFSSASRLRDLFQGGAFRQASPFVPEKAYSLFRRDYALGIAGSSFYNLTPAVLYHLQAMETQQLADLPDMGEGLENRLRKAARQACTLDELLAGAKSKRYPMSRVKRAVAYAMLGMTREDAALSPAYLRVLAFNERGQEILRAVKKTATLPVYHSFAKLERDFPVYARKEALATELFRLGLPKIQPTFSEYRDQRPSFISMESPME